ncbi:unnamed protein product, partial [Didymodactylos carnosus]
TIDETISTIFDHRGLSFANLSTCCGAATCFNRTLVFNKNIVLLPLVNDNENLNENVIMFCSMLLKMLHEFFHILRRSIFRSSWNLFYKRTPPRKTVSRGNIKIAEGSWQLEDGLFGFIYESIGLEDAEFLLDIRNWKSLSHDQFRKRLLEIKLFSTEENKSVNRWTLPSRGSNLSDNVDESIDDTAHTYEARMELKQCALVDLRCDNMC